MELWYSEFHTGNVKLSVRINRQLFSGESEFQRIDVFESEEFGRFVALDGEIVFLSLIHILFFLVDITFKNLVIQNTVINHQI